MADKMIRVAGRTDGGLAKAISVDNSGLLMSNTYGDITRIITSGTLPAKVGETNGTRASDMVWFGSDLVTLYTYISGSTSTPGGHPITVEYYDALDALIYTETLADWSKLVDSKFVIRFIPTFSKGKIVITNPTASARTTHTDMVRGPKTTITPKDTRLQRRTSIPYVSFEGNGTPVQLNGANFTFGENTDSWALYFMLTRSLWRCINSVRIRVEFTNSAFSDATGGYTVFRQDFALSATDEFNKALAIDCTDPLVGGPPDRVSVVLAGKYVNIPMAKYMRIYLYSTRDDAAEGASLMFTAQGITLVEEGNY